MSFCIFDNMLLILAKHTAAQLVILGYEMEQTIDKYKYTDDNLVLKSVKFRSLIRRHQEIIKFVDQIEDIYSIIYLVQTIVSSFMLCVVAIQAFLFSIIKSIF